MLKDNDFIAHHVGCLTKDIEASLMPYKMMGFNSISPIYKIADQRVSVCFVEIAATFFLELVQFADDNIALAKLFKSKNPYYHIGYFVKDINSSIDKLSNEGFYLVNKFTSEAFNGKTCAFMYSPEMHLIELIG